MAFLWKEKLSLRNELSSLSRPIDLTVSGGINRRAVGLMPSPTSEASRLLAQSNTLKHKQLMLTIEGGERSLCLRVSSPKRKSRSAGLIFRGQVLGCIHGSKESQGQIFGKEAFDELYYDLVNPDSIVERYDLPETIVLAAASLFHGTNYKQNNCQDSKSAYQDAVDSQISEKSAGCVVISREDSTIAGFVYFFNGELIGVYSYKSGWLKPSIDSGLDILLTTSGALIMSSHLIANSIEQVRQLSFGLSGIKTEEIVKPCIEGVSVFNNSTSTIAS